jgi:hypothetical protein
MSGIMGYRKYIEVEVMWINMSQRRVIIVYRVCHPICVYRWKLLEAKLNARICFLDSSIPAREAE